MASLASEWFGLRNFASNYCLLQVLLQKWHAFLLMANYDMRGVWPVISCACFDLTVGPSHDAHHALQLAPALGVYLLATRLAGCLYDREAERQGSVRHCTGSACFRCLVPASMLHILTAVGFCLHLHLLVEF